MARVNLSLSLDKTSSTFVGFPSLGFFEVFWLVGSRCGGRCARVGLGPPCLIFDTPHFKALLLIYFSCYRSHTYPRRGVPWTLFPGQFDYRPGRTRANNLNTL
jgi:hypothetical protein